MLSLPAIEAEGLVKHYRKVIALDRLDFTVQSGRLTGFLGPNGAGKTTTFRALLGLTRPNAGSIRVLDREVPRDLRSLVKEVGAIVEEPGLVKSISGRRNLGVAADTLGFGHERIPELLAFVELEDDAHRLVGQYSKGMRQRLALAAALLPRPRLLILDEPLDGLDPAGQHAFRVRLRQLVAEGTTVLVSSHDLADIEALADDVIVINKGRLVAQGPLVDILAGAATRIVTAEIEAATTALASAGIGVESVDGGLVAATDNGRDVIRILASAGIYPDEVRSERSTLEAVFLGMTEPGS